jgi:hypothetical protein
VKDSTYEPADPIGGLKLGLLCYGVVEDGAEWNADAGASRVDHSGRGYHKGYEIFGAKYMLRSASSMIQTGLPSICSELPSLVPPSCPMVIGHC